MCIRDRVGDVLVTREVLVLRNMSVPDQMEVLRHRIKAARRVCYDSVSYTHLDVYKRQV